MSHDRLRLYGLPGIPDVEPGDDLAALAVAAAARADLRFSEGDVLVVCQKVVSRSEGRFVRLDEIQPSGVARAWAAAHDRDPRVVQVVLGEARRIVRADRGVLVTETRHGFVCANSGVDQSNAPPGAACMLPEDPDRSARALRDGIERAAGSKPGVVIIDSWGRPFRLGAVDVAIGVAGLPATVDCRGCRDRSGRELTATTLATADAVAAAAGLVMGKLRGVPMVLVRGLRTEGVPGPDNGKALLRSAGEDLFR